MFVQCKMAIPLPRGIQELVFVAAAVVLVNSSQTSEAGYCVNPIEDEPCDCATALDACHTLDEYLSAPGDYFTTGATFRFMAGQHSAHRTFNGSDIANLTFAKDKAETNVRITLSAVSNISAWLVLSNSSGISLSGINFEMNSSAVNHTCYNFILEFRHVYDIEFSDTSCVSNCGGYVSVSYGHNVEVSNATLSYSNHSGFYISNTTGSITIERITFTGSSAPSIFIYSSYYSLDCSLHNKLVIDDCLFQYVSSGLELILEEMAGCLNIYVKNSLFTGLGDFGMELNSIESHLEWLFEVELDNNTFYNSATVGIVLSLYAFNRMHINNCIFRDHLNTAVEIFMGHNPNATAYFENSLFINNRVPPGTSNVPATALAIQSLEGCSEHSIQNFTFRNVSFIGNGHSIIETPTVVLCINHLKVIDCHFINNSGTPLQAVSSVLSLEGSIDFINNTARQGAAMYFYGESKMNLNASETNVTFKNNNAFLTGGAIQISNNNKYPPFSTPLCFLSVQDSGTTLLSFTNNTAGNGGDAIYGGSLDQAMSDYDNHSCIQVIEAVSYFNPQMANISLISSEPSRVCFCENDTPYCLNFSKTFSVFPGQTLTFYAYVVGQHFGTSKGAVYAQFLEEDTSVDSLDRAQKVNQYSCGHESNKLQYLVKPSKTNVTRLLVLTAKDVPVTDYYYDNAIEEAVQSYINSGNTTIPLELLQVPIYGIVSIKQCPVGFVFSGTKNSCVCMDQLHQLVSKYDVRCYIHPVPRLQRKKSLWIYPDPSNNTFSYSEKCLPEYCNASRIEIQVEEGSPDTQCIDNHAGILCGGCRENFSLAIGSSRCLQQCKNSYLSLLLVFAVAGLLLVALIKYLDLTVTQGTLNGLIFYANIIQTSKSAFLEPSSNGSRVFAVIIAWFNLDFGIEVCFIRNLDIYTKTWLQFVFPLYIWILAVGIIIACRYSLRITRFFGNNAVQVLATLILLSFNKLLRTIAVVYTLAQIVRVDTANHRQVTETVWAHNGHFNVGFVFLAAAATVFVLLWFPFTIFLLLGPCLQRYNHRRGLKWVGKMTPFLDAYYGPFKEKHLYWVGVLLIARVVVIIPAAIPSLNTGGSLLTVAILTAFLLFYMASVGGVYKKNYQSALEESFLVNLIMFSALLSHSNKTQYIAAYISFVHVVLVLLALIIHQVCQRKRCQNEVLCVQVFKWSSVSRREYHDIDDGLMSDR